MLSKVMLAVRTLLQYICVLAIMVGLGLPIMILIVVLPDRYRYTNRLLFRLFTWFYQAIIWCTWVSVKVIGPKSLFARGPAIIVANHQSALDIALVGAQLQGTPHAWFALAQFNRHPLLGPFVRRLGFGVDSTNHQSSTTSMRRSIRYAHLYPGHIIIFPEGGRFTDGMIHPFMRGFSLLAKHTRRPVIPLYMPYNAQVYPPGSFFIYPHPLEVVIGRPFMRQRYESDEAFCQRVQAWFEDLTKEYEGRKAV